MTLPQYDLERLERILGGVSLTEFRARLRARFERGSSASVLTLTRLAVHERETLTGLLGRRPRDASSLRVSLLELDEALARAGLADNLRHALELLDGPIPDRFGERIQLERGWTRAFSEPTHPRLRVLLERNAARGLVKRLSGGDPCKAIELLRMVERVLASLPARGRPRSQLAAETTGDAHALDAGRPLATIVLASLREQEDERPRETWASVGVLVNELAKPALALNLPAEPTSAAGALAETARALGEPVALSLRALLRSEPSWKVSKRRVFVCENANVLAIAADRLGASCAPIVCTDGMPSATQRTLLRQLAEQGACLHYHGDFDWPGVRIGNFVTRSFGAVAWKFNARDYRARGGRILRGVPVAADWDAELRQTMIDGGYAVDEEAVANELIDDLGSAGAQR